MHELDLRQYFHIKEQARLLRAQRPLPVFLRNILYPDSRVRTWPQPLLPLSEIKAAVHNVPVVRRGSQAVRMPGEDLSSTWIEPHGPFIEDTISAVELNNWRLLSSTSIQAAVDSKLEKQMLAARRTVAALAAQSGTGKIAYQMKTDQGADLYEVDFGAAGTLICDKKWSDATTKLRDVYDFLRAMEQLIRDKGWGGRVVFPAGKDAYSALLAMTDAESGRKNPITVKLVDYEGYKAIDVSGHIVIDSTASYRGVDGSMVPEIPASQVMAVDLDAPHTLFYCALDCMEAGLQPLPFFSSHEYKKNPSRVAIYGETKPLPAPVVDAIVWATVLQ